MKEKNNKVGVIIAAAGSGSRMGGVYKPLENLCGQQMLLYSLDVFMKSEDVAFVVISARSDKVREIQKLCNERSYSKPLLVVEGGSDRQQSVENAFSADLFDTLGASHVAIHDAARPLFDEQMAKKAFVMAFEKGNAVCACRVRDTVKHTDENCVIDKGVDRDNLWLIQTPQIFERKTYSVALERAKAEGLCVTDDSSLVANIGTNVNLCETPSYNIKITYPEDVLLAEAILEKRGREKCSE